MSLATKTKETFRYIFKKGDFNFCEQSLDTLAYPIDFNFLLNAKRKYFRFKDKDGIPLVEYKSCGKQYSYPRIATYAFGHFNKYLIKHDERSKEIFLNAADWFLKFEDGIYRNSFDWDEQKLKAPWISGIAQGKAISVLIRAYDLTKQQKYLDQAIKGTRVFSKYIEEGGVRCRIDKNWEFLEEYPSEKPIHVLNGFLYALVGIFDLSKFYPQIMTETGFESLLDAFKANWGMWDLGFWSAYDLSSNNAGFRNAATMTYHNIHVSLIKFLSLKLKDPELEKCFYRWQGYSHGLSNRIRAWLMKFMYHFRN